MESKAEVKRVMERQPIELFYAYSHKDEELRAELEKHLSILKRQGAITGWHFRKIGAGTEWHGEIDKHLNAARVILLLVSADFLASDYCYDVEMKRAIERHEGGEALVIPVIIRPVLWEGAPFGKLQALPKDARPVTSWPNRDEAFTDIARGVSGAVLGLTGFPPQPQNAALAAPLPASFRKPVSLRTIPIAEATRSIVGAFDVMLVWDNQRLAWKYHIPGGPDSANTLDSITPGAPVWIKANRAVSWTRGGTTVGLVSGWNLLVAPQLVECVS